MIVKELTREECAAVISKARFARLACAHENQPYIVPIYFASAGNHLYSFSMPGQKVEWMRANPKVCVQIDEYAERQNWRSVVIYGLYEELPDRIGSKHERDRAWSLLREHANWWEPGGLKPVPGPMASASTHLFYRIATESVTGRQGVAYP